MSRLLLSPRARDVVDEPDRGTPARSFAHPKSGNTLPQEVRDRLPPGLRDKAQLFMEYSKVWQGLEVPDPYSGGPDGFEQVLDMIEDACTGLIEDIKKELGR